MNTKSLKKKEHGRYKVDTRPLCQGMHFILTDAAHPRMVLKNGSHFLVLDQGASIPACNTLGYGYYRNDTRFISEWELLLNGHPLSLLSTNVTSGYSATFLHTNVKSDNIPQQKIIVQREVVMHDLLWEKISVESFLNACVDLELTVRFQSDFADMFEVRGLNREQRGERMIPVPTRDHSALFLAYRGLDGVLLESLIEFHGLTPSKIEEGEVTFHLSLHGRRKMEFEISVSTALNGRELSPDPSRIGYEKAKEAADLDYDRWSERGSSVHTDHDLFNLVLDRGLRDIYILRQPTPKGHGLAAGIPWYSTVFGRDSVITAWQMLPFLPELAREVIHVLGKYQGTKDSEYTEEHPGRIMHEIRFGEMSRAKQIPHTPYYGTVDATQLWILLVAEYVNWSGDLELAQKLYPKLKSAVEFLNKNADGGGGYVTYQCLNEDGLVNKGWKDSHDSVVFSNGQLGKHPIALCEAQAYFYAAKIALAGLADKINHKSFATRLRSEASGLKDRFQRDFWMPDEQFLAAALDADGRQVDGFASNPGHCLFTEILDEDKAHRVADKLMEPVFWSGWGIRTLAANNAAYNPISYHNGSIWPHDNSMIAYGMRKIGKIEYVHKILEALYEVSQSQVNYRLPELICGFGKDDTDNPIDYPVSCSPQAWAAGSMFQLLAACMNIQPDAPSGRLRIVEPSIPKWLDRVKISKMRVGDATVSLAFKATKTITSCEILRKDGNLKVIIEN